MDHFKFSTTPITKLNALSKDLECSIFMKRDDLFEHAGGGSKARMLQYIIHKAIRLGHNYIVTAGGPYSNFNRALALMCGKYNLKMVLVLYDKNRHINKTSLNKKICDFCEISYVLCDPDKVVQTVEEHINILKSQGERPYYIWGGGKSNEGVYAYYACVKEMSRQLTFKPDILCAAVGTGTTISGLTLGAQHYMPTTEVLGISVAREKLACVKVLTQIYKEFNMDNNFYEPHWANIVNDHFLMGGYGSTSKELDSFLKKYIKNEGIIMDNIYVGKALFGLYNIIKNDQKYKNKMIMFLNTGGIYNF